MTKTCLHEHTHKDCYTHTKVLNHFTHCMGKPIETCLKEKEDYFLL